VAFAFSSDSSVADEGTYLDDIVLRKDTAPAPEISNVSPRFASAGTGQQMTLSGANFGAAPGRVDFWWVGSTWTSALILSWSDTEVRCEIPAPASSNGSMGVKLTRDGGAHDTHLYGVSFSYHGWRWPSLGSWPEICAMPKYYIYENTADCPNPNVGIRQAAHRWNDLDFHYLSLRWWGFTTREAPSYDGYNVLRWGSTDGSIATCTTWYSGDTILEFDIEFEDSYNWSRDTVCPPDCMDIMNIAAHELGHGGVGFYDLYGNPDAERTMYGYASRGETIKRTPHTHDIAGIRWIYWP
jgi:hypothetical protein